MQRTEERVVYALIVNDDDVTFLIMASFSFFHNFLIDGVLGIKTQEGERERERESLKRKL